MDESLSQTKVADVTSFSALQISVDRKMILRQYDETTAVQRIGRVGMPDDVVMLRPDVGARSCLDEVSNGGNGICGEDDPWLREDVHGPERKDRGR